MPDYVGNVDVSNDDTLGPYEYIDFYSTKDIVESDLEEEDEDEIDQDNDDEDDKAFCSKDRTFNLDDEPKDFRLDRFHQRMGNIVSFLVGKGKEAVSGDFDPDDKWVCNEFVQPLGKHSVEEILDIFNDIIPESTRAILGCATLTPEHIMALPSVNHSASDPGVYLICFEKVSRGLKAADVQFVAATEQDHKVPSGLYTGSSVKSVSGRCVDHGALFKKFSTKRLIGGRYLENGTKVMYLYCYANLHGLVPVYRQVGVFSQQLENIDLLPVDVQWLVRLLEQAMILLLDVYEPCKDPNLRRTVGYSDRMYEEMLEECGVPSSVFHPLNHAMPLKQGTCNTRKFVKHVCHNCGATSTATWYIDHAAPGEALLYNCSACYWYRSRRVGEVRPSSLFNSFRARPTAGPCSNCHTTESPLWDWHPAEKDRVICTGCRSYWSRNKADRPKKREKQCAECGAKDTKNHWHSAYDESGRKTGEYWCATCAMKRKRDVDKEAKQNDYVNCICSICGGTNLPAWKTAITCLSCWQESTSDEYWKRSRDRVDCWNCHRPFQKQKMKPLRSKDWRFERQWHPELKEWICQMCCINGQRHGCFGVTTTHLKDLKIRCEDCHVLYAKRWTTLGKTSLERIDDSSITWDRIICGNCYKKRSMLLLRKASRKDEGKDKTDTSAEIVFANKSNDPRMPGGLTWQEYQGKDLGDEPFSKTKLLLTYLLRVHGVDLRNDKIIADKMMDDLELDDMDTDDE